MHLLYSLDVLLQCVHMLELVLEQLHVAVGGARDGGILGAVQLMKRELLHLGLELVDLPLLLLEGALVRVVQLPNLALLARHRL